MLHVRVLVPSVAATVLAAVAAVSLGCTGANPAYRPRVADTVSNPATEGKPSSGPAFDSGSAPATEAPLEEETPTEAGDEADAGASAEDAQTPPSDATPDSGGPSSADAEVPDAPPALPPDMLASPGTPLARWPLDPGPVSGTDRSVPAGNLRGGAAIDAPGFEGASFPNSGSLRLDGADDYATLSVTGLPAFEQTKTVSFWYWLPAVPSGRQYMVVFAASSNGPALEFLLDNGYPIVYVGGVSSGVDLRLPGRAHAGWNHIAYTYTPSGQANRCYRDGALDLSRTLQARAGRVNELLLGTVDPGGHPDNFAGRIDDFRIYDRPLDASEIDALFRGAP